jgi:hypothetical protein
MTLVLKWDTHRYAWNAVSTHTERLAICEMEFRLQEVIGSQALKLTSAGFKPGRIPDKSAPSPYVFRRLTKPCRHEALREAVGEALLEFGERQPNDR